MRKFLTVVLLAIPLFFGAPAVPAITAAHYVTVTIPQANPNATVWVNTDSGVYHCPGTRWYGKTKQGRYMKQKEAQAAGHRPAYGSVCA
jgi:hypothetical protein